MDAVGEAYYFHKVHGASYWTKVKKFCRGLYKQHRDLLRGRSLFYILITCFIDFGLMFVWVEVCYITNAHDTQNTGYPKLPVGRWNEPTETSEITQTSIIFVLKEFSKIIIKPFKTPSQGCFWGEWLFFLELSKEKWSRVMYNFKGRWPYIILTVKLLNNFSSCLQRDLKHFKMSGFTLLQTVLFVILTELF